MSAPVLTSYKLLFFKKRFYSTLLGGYRFSFESDKIPSVLHLFQIIVYVIPTIVTAVLGAILENKYIAALIPLAINVILLLSLLIYSRWKNTNKPGIYSYVFRSRYFGEVLFSFILTAGFTFLLGWHINHLAKLEETGTKIISIVFTAIAATNYYCSLFIDSPYETTAVINKSPEFHMHSDMYSRPLYGAIILLIKILIENKKSYEDFSDFSTANLIGTIVFIMFPYLMSFALIGNLFLTITWAIEYININFFGDSVKSSYARTVMAFVFNIFAGLLASIGFSIGMQNGNFYAYLVMAFLSFVSNTNYMCDINIARIFRDKSKKKRSRMIGFIFMFILIMGGTAAIAAIRFFAENRNMDPGGNILLAVTIGLFVIQIFLRFVSESMVLAVRYFQY
jgi:hypothetical protein